MADQGRDRYAISVDGLSKRFLLGARHASYGTLRDAISAMAKAPLRLLAGTRTAGRRNEEQELWALNDVSFHVEPGEVVGIIGRNGAGKSTLLKILSRISEPTRGVVDVRGRVGSLLEVGTGFHPELTGRENMYLAGAILGMKKAEIDRKFDEIVAFSEVERFIDTPVKHYSSGMYVRLAFAVGAHLEPDILLVDEVLSVGDLAFQQKCLTHMRRLTRSGMTILLVSHSMASIQSSCSRAILLRNGRIDADGAPTSVIEQYRRSMKDLVENKATEVGRPAADGAESQVVEILGLEMFGEDGESKREFRFGERLRVRIDLYAHKRVEAPMINFGIKRGDGVNVCNFNNWYDNFRVDYIQGACSMEVWLPPLRLIPDFYETHVLVWPWGGGHLEGNLQGARPYAWATAGDFHISGTILNSHDGVFQIPSARWCLTSERGVQQYDGMSDNSIFEVSASAESLDSTTASLIPRSGS